LARATRRTVATGATLATLSQFLTAAFGGLLGILVARLLGPAETGAFSVALSGLLLLSLLSTVGIHVGATYYVSRGEWAAGDAFRQSQLGAFVLGCGGALLGLVLAESVANEALAELPDTAIALLLAAIPFAVSWTVSSYVALGLDRYEVYATASVSANFGALVLVCILAPRGGIEGAVAGLAAAQLVTAAGYLAWGRSRLKTHSPGWGRRAAANVRRAASFGLKSYSTTVLSLIVYRADLFILSAVVGGAAVGHYAVALAVAELGMLLPRALNAVVFPRVASLDRQASARDADEQLMVITKSIRHSLLQAPLTALTLIIALLLVPLIYGSEFRPAIEPGLILIPGVLLLGIANVMSAVVSGKGRPEYALYAWLIAAPAALALYAVLIPELGTEGAALASSVAYALNAILGVYFLQRTMPLPSVVELLPHREELSDYRRVASRAWARLSRTSR
jgi:O-antigen/teichoic acid export membrane protein